MRVADDTESPSSLKRMMRTPWVWRFSWGMVEMLKRMTWPLTEMVMTSRSSLSLTTMAVTSGPVLAVTSAVLMPEPPRPWVL